jgi:hypothetical protein
MPFALLVIVLAAAWRIVAVHVPGLGNFSPVMALAFCGGVYFRSPWMRVAPFAAVVLSDVYLDRYYAAEYHYTWSSGGCLVRMACIAAALGLGILVSRRRSWLNLASGTLGGAVLFYLVTNTHAWYFEGGYAISPAGWWQAMTVGRPSFPPTLFFFRNTLASDLLFVSLFSCAMESLARSRGEPSLFDPRRSLPATTV